MAWIGQDTAGKHQWVPKALFDQAVHHAQESLKPDDSSDEESAS